MQVQQCNKVVSFWEVKVFLLVFPHYGGFVLNSGGTCQKVFLYTFGSAIQWFSHRPLKNKIIFTKGHLLEVNI